jgi:pilus assembly protein Flp/PilA
MMHRTISAVKAHFPEREEAQGMVEYGLIIALVAVVAIAGLIILGPKIASLFTGLGASV